MKVRLVLAGILAIGALSACANTATTSAASAPAESASAPAESAFASTPAETAPAPAESASTPAKSASQSHSSSPTLTKAAVCTKVQKAMGKYMKYAEQNPIITKGSAVAIHTADSAEGFNRIDAEVADAIVAAAARAGETKTRQALQDFAAKLRKPIAAGDKASDPNIGPDWKLYRKSGCDLEISVNF